MAHGLDVQKRQEWEERFERHRSGGLTVAQFCAQEHVSVNTFYYWAKRVGSQPGRVQAPRAGKTPKAMPKHVRQAPALDLAPAANAGVVYFRLGAAVEVAVPANCLDVIRGLAHWLQPSSVERAEVFQEVVVGTR